ncbi:MAG: hypothetical protein VKO21_05230 [Candidatus Sericytochromatia bacterium]|nr:hypothetical protein [Candidatus Sericytochromatia bacterium]
MMWSTAEDRALLKALIAGVPIGDLTRALGRSYGALEARSKKVVLEHVAGRPMPETHDERLSEQQWGMARFRNAGALRRRQLHEVHPRAYAPWSPDEDRAVLQALREGLGIGEMAARHQRQPTAIRSRLNELALNLVWNCQPVARQIAGS